MLVCVFFFLNFNYFEKKKKIPRIREIIPLMHNIERKRYLGLSLVRSYQFLLS